MTTDISGHRNLMYSAGVPHAVQALAHTCSGLPIRIGEETTSVDLVQACTNDEAADILLDHANPGTRDIQGRRYGYSLMAGALPLEFPVDNVFPDLLRNGFRRSVDLLAGDTLDGLSEWALDCDVEAGVSLASFREEAMVTFCTNCARYAQLGHDAFVDEYCVESFGQQMCDDPETAGWARWPGSIIAMRCAYLDDHFSPNGLSGFQDAFCDDLPDAVRDALVIEDIRAGWVERRVGGAVEPALRVDFDFAASQKVATLDIYANGSCEGPLADIINQWGGDPRPLDTLLASLGSLISAGSYDVYVEQFALSVDIVVTADGGVLRARPEADVRIGGVRTDPVMDGGLDLATALSIGGISLEDLADSVETQVEQAFDDARIPDQLADFLSAGVPEEHDICRTFIDRAASSTSNRLGVHVAWQYRVPQIPSYQRRWEWDPILRAYVARDPDPVPVDDPCASEPILRRTGPGF